MGNVKQKCVFEHAQNAQIQIRPANAQSLASRKHAYIILTLLNPTFI